MNKGFTLIELLVVVLIIGILAAIALPQYTKAVERSRMAEAVQILGDLATAESIAYMQEGTFKAINPNDVFDGDVAVPVPADGGTWNYKSEFVSGTDATSGVKLIATRNGGMFGTAELTLQVDPDGKITKTCDSKSKKGFAAIANTNGYTGTSCVDPAN